MGGRILTNRLLIVVLGAFLPAVAAAEIVDFSCGNFEFNLDIERSTMNGNPVSWAREGDWLTWTDISGSKVGVNLTDGAYKDYNNDDVSPPGNCFPPDVVELEASRDSSFLEVAFAARSVDERQWIQTVLRESDLYTGAIDGLWGDGTNSALLSYCVNEVKSNVDADGCLDSVVYAFEDGL